MVTTSRIAASETVVNIASSIDLTIAAGTSFEGDLCSGGGLGAIVLFCTVSNFTSQIYQLFARRIENNFYLKNRESVIPNSKERYHLGEA